MIFLHPMDPFALYVFVDSDCDVIQEHVPKVSGISGMSYEISRFLEEAHDCKKMESTSTDHKEMPDTMIERNFFFHKEKCAECVARTTDDKK